MRIEPTMGQLPLNILSASSQDFNIRTFREFFFRFKPLQTQKHYFQEVGHFEVSTSWDRSCMDGIPALIKDNLQKKHKRMRVTVPFPFHYVKTQQRDTVYEETKFSGYFF